MVQFDKGKAYLDFNIKGAIGSSRTLRLYHDGRHPPRLGIRVGREFAPVFFISSDGARLRIAYRDCKYNPHVAIIYFVDPVELYELGEPNPRPVLDGVKGISQVFQIDSVKLLRSIESVVQRVGTTYDVGRLGAEIALAVAKTKLGLEDTVLVEPSQPGVDLFSPGSRVAIQARLLIGAHYPGQHVTEEFVKKQVVDMVKSVRRDMNRMHDAQAGYAIISIANAGWTTQTTVLQVLPPRLS